MSLAGPFMFDPRAFWGDEDVRLMNGEQVAAYLKLLSLQWENGDVPADARKLAGLMSEGVRNYTAADLVGGGTLEAPLEGSLWDGLKPCFRVDNGRMWNERLATEREDWVRKKDAMSKGGKKGGRRSAKSRAKEVTGVSSPSSPPSSPPSEPPLSQAPMVGEAVEVVEKVEEEVEDSDSDAPTRAAKGDRDGQQEAAAQEGPGTTEGPGSAAAGDDPAAQGGADTTGDAKPGLHDGGQQRAPTSAEGVLAPRQGEPPAEAEPDQPGVEAAEPNGLDLGDLADRLIQIAGSSVQVSHRDGDILIRRVELRRQPPEELILAARILAGQFRGGAPNKLEYVSQPIAYLDKGPWDRMAGFVTFRRCWREGFAEFWGDEPLAATAWFDTFEDRQAASEAAGGDRVLRQLAVHKGSKQWRDGKVPSPERWLRGHRFNDTPRPASSGRKRPGAQPEDVEAERDRRFNIVR